MMRTKPRKKPINKDKNAVGNKPGFTLPEDLGELRRGGRGDVDCVLNLANASLIGAVPASISMPPQLPQHRP